MKRKKIIDKLKKEKKSAKKIRKEFQDIDREMYSYCSGMVKGIIFALHLLKKKGKKK